MKTGSKFVGLRIAVRAESAARFAIGCLGACSGSRCRLWNPVGVRIPRAIRHPGCAPFGRDPGLRCGTSSKFEDLFADGDIEVERFRDDRQIVDEFALIELFNDLA